MYAIFDLDNTITRRDTYIPFLVCFLFHFPSRLIRTYILIRPLIQYFNGKITNTQLKEYFLYAFLNDIHLDILRPIIKKFTKRIVKRGIFETARKRIKEHRDKGDILVLASASLDVYVNCIGWYLEMDLVIATPIEINKNGKITGRLNGDNLKGVAKLEACKKAIGEKLNPNNTIVYSDHISDLPLLTWAQTGIVVNGKNDVKKAAQKLNLRLETWR